MRSSLSPRARVALGASALTVGALLTRRLLSGGRSYSFRGRCVLITGGSRGLGYAMAQQLAEEGARLWLVARSPDALATAAASLRTRGAVVDTVAADIRHEDEIDRIVTRIERAGETVDVLINNAGVIEVSPFEHARTADFEDSLATHFWGPLHLIRKLLPQLRLTGEGRVVNISSIGGRVGVPHLSAYAAGKFALTGLSEVLRAELGKYGIAVTTVTPGLLRTGSYVNARVRGQHEEEFRWFAAMSATSLTSMQASRAAAEILRAARAGRATVSPGWQARAAEIASAVAPGTFAGVTASVDRWALPPPSHAPEANDGKLGADIDPGLVGQALPGATRRQYQQPEPSWGAPPPRRSRGSDTTSS